MAVILRGASLSAVSFYHLYSTNGMGSFLGISGGLGLPFFTRGLFGLRYHAAFSEALLAWDLRHLEDVFGYRVRERLRVLGG